MSTVRWWGWRSGDAWMPEIWVMEKPSEGLFHHGLRGSPIHVSKRTTTSPLILRIAIIAG